MDYEKHFCAGTHRPGRFLYVFNNPRDIAICDDWNAFFLWKHKAVTPCGYTKGLLSGPDVDNVMQWRTTPYEKTYSGLGIPFMRTVGMDHKTNDEKPFAVIYYERSEELPHLDELAKLQIFCEQNMEKISIYDFRIREDNDRLFKPIIPSRRREYQRELEEAKCELPRLIEETNKMFDRVREIRREINGN